MSILTLPRRTLLTGALSAGIALDVLPVQAAKAVAPVLPSDGRIAFNVFRHGSHIGTHTLNFTNEPDGFSVQIAVEFKVGLGFITLFRYQMEATERWRDGQFTELTSTTDHNGTRLEVHALRKGDDLVIDATKITSYTVPPGTLPLTHWNRAQMQTPLFNPETGKIGHEKVTDAGIAPVPMPGSGAPDSGRHYILTGDARIEDWYDGESWIALSAIAKDGSTVLYQRA